MTGDPRPGRQPDPADDVVPHPFRGGSLGGRSTDPGTGGAEETAAEPAEASEVGAEASEGVDESAGAEPGGPTDPVVSEPGELESGGSEPGEFDGPAAGPAEAARESDAAPPPAGAAEPVAAPEVKPARRSRDPLAAVLIGLLTLLLGFAFAVQVRSVGDDQEYAGAREEDLVRILDDLDAREERLRDQISDQRTALQQLSGSDSQSAAALEEARARAEAIGILNGTIAAQGPGLVMSIRDPDEEVRVSDILDAIQELRGAGAETMQIDDVRVGVSTAITGTPGSLMVDGRPITAPYEFVVIGSPQNMQTALNIPGGVVQDLNRQGATVEITPSDQVVVDALRPLDTPQYAAPDTDD